MNHVKRILLDGQPTWKLKCPNCGTWAEADDDMIHGRVSSDCPNCDFHETRNWLAP